MEQNHIAFQKTGYFSSLICNYLDEKSELSSFFNRYPKLDNFKNQIKQKGKSFSLENRRILVSVLKKQYQDVNSSQLTKQHIDSLKSENTFTITTGHQLNLFSGPLYFLYKIVSTINLSTELKARYPENNFVPVYWMATEDHDFDEINYFNFKGKKFQWSKDVNGAVGALSTEGLDEVFKLFSKDLGTSTNAANLKLLFKNAYLNNDNLADATRFLANELFKNYGLVIIDANNKALKQLFTPYIETELLNQTSFKAVTITNEKLSRISEDYKIQVNPREINLFLFSRKFKRTYCF